MCRIICFAILATFLMMTAAHGEDMRMDARAAARQQREMAERAKQEAEEAKIASLERHRRIVSDRASLKRAIEHLQAENLGLGTEIRALEKTVSRLETEETRLQQELEETEAVNRELAGFARGYSKDLQVLMGQSPQSALMADRDAFLHPLIDDQRMPSMDDLKQMTDVLFEEIRLSGEVRRTRGEIVDREGREVSADLLLLGNFTAFYVLPEESGFLLYSDQSRRFFALSRLPERQMVRKNLAYFQGQSDDVFMDISKGAALRQLTHERSLLDQIPQGGPIVWPIVAIFGIALLIVLERVFFLASRHMNADTFMKKVGRYVDQGKWEECARLFEEKKKKLVPKILGKALSFRNQDRSDMENALQEAILGEIPRLERFLSTLGILAAIAPLLGLLGTVTGMINTFHVITYYGTGDPRMMSGGISEALVTTMLGLTAAIPIMLAHTLLSRRIESEIGKMEEKAVSFVNMVFKSRQGTQE